MICQLCKLQVHKVYKVIKRVKIYECEKCKLGFVNQSAISSKTKARIGKLYNISSYIKNEQKLRRRLNMLADIILKYKRQGKLLDIGGGYGLFSEIFANKAKFKIDLIEPILTPVLATSENIKIIRKTLRDFSRLPKYRGHDIIAEDEKYDLVLLMDVLEHFRDPITDLKIVKALLKKNGIIVIQTPNYQSLMAKICLNWSWWMVEDHKYFFTPVSLQKILEITGFRYEYIMTYEDWQDFKKNLNGNFTQVKNKFVRKIVKALFFVFFIPIYFFTRQIIWKHDSGGLIFTIYSES